MAPRFTLVQADMIRPLPYEPRLLIQRMAARAPASVERKGDPDFPMLGIPASASEEEKQELIAQLQALHDEVTRELFGELTVEAAQAYEDHLYGKLETYGENFRRCLELLESSSTGYRGTAEPLAMWTWMDVCEASAFYRKICALLPGVTPRAFPLTFPESLRPRARTWFDARNIPFPTL